MSKIHPNAFVDPDAVLGAGCEVGPFAVIHAGVRMGGRNRIFAGAVIGGDPQDLKYNGQKTLLEIGDDNLFREFVTVNRGTEEGGGTTRIGSHNLFMAYSHVAHDCVVGDHIVLANSVAIAGHCHVGDHAIVGGLTGLHQHARIGMASMVGALSRLSKDVLPFSTTSGCDEVKVYALNKIGLKRRGVPKPEIEALEHAFHLYTKPGSNASDALKALEAITPKTPQVQHLLDFVKSSSRGVYR